MPEGFCHHAWYGLYKKVSILQCGGGVSRLDRREINQLYGI